MLTDKFWDKYFEVYDVLNELMPYRDLLSKFVAHSDAKQGWRVLDAGAGTGNLSLRFHKLGAKVFALDMSRAGLKRISKKIPSAEVRLGSLCESLPYKDQSFDLVVTNNVIYAIAPEVRASIAKEFHRVLKTGGKIIVSNVAPGFSPINIYLHHIKEEGKKHGWFYVLERVLHFLPPTIKMFWYNMRIKKENKGGQYDFMDDESQESFLSSGGFTKIESLGRVYAGQAVMHSAIK